MTKPKIKTTKTHTDIAQQVMAQIKTGQVTMRPKAYFIAGSLMLGIGFVGIIITGTLFTALSTFHFRTFGSQNFLSFGSHGIVPFLAAMPWIPLLITILSFSVGLKLLQRYDISYKKNFLALGIGLVFTVTILGLIIDRTNAHTRLQTFGPVKPFYRQHFVDKQFIVGQVIGSNQQQYSVATPNGQQVTVQTNESTHYPRGQDIQVGDTVHAVGQWQDDVFEAKGIGKGMAHFPTRSPFPSGQPGRMYQRAQ